MLRERDYMHEVPEWMRIGDARKNLREIDAACRELSRPYCCVAGTLLGCIRHQGFVPWDKDIDLMVAESDIPNLHDDLSVRGFAVEYFHYPMDRDRPSDNRYGPLLVATKYGVKCEFWPGRRSGDTILTYAGPYSVADVMPLRRFAFEDFFVNVPARPEVLLDRLYGDWRTTYVKQARGVTVSVPSHGPLPPPVEIPMEVR